MTSTFSMQTNSPPVLSVEQKRKQITVLLKRIKQLEGKISEVYVEKAMRTLASVALKPQYASQRLEINLVQQQNILIHQGAHHHENQKDTSNEFILSRPQVNNQQLPQTISNYSLHNQESKQFVRSGLNLPKVPIQPTIIPVQKQDLGLSDIQGERKIFRDEPSNFSEDSGVKIKRKNSFRRKDTGKIVVRGRSRQKLVKQDIYAPVLLQERDASTPYINEHYPDNYANSLEIHPTVNLRPSSKEIITQRIVANQQLLDKPKSAGKITPVLIKNDAFKKLSQSKASLSKQPNSKQKFQSRYNKPYQKQRQKTHQKTQEMQHSTQQQINRQQINNIFCNSQNSQDQSFIEQSNNIKLLEFNTEKEQYRLDNAPSSVFNYEKRVEIRYRNLNVSKLNNFEEFLNLLPSLPQLPDPPTLDNTQEELLAQAKNVFELFGVFDLDNSDVSLNVKKFKNCVFFGISSQYNILWHYDGKVYFGEWKYSSQGEGQKSGSGLQFSPGRYLFQGQYSNGKRNGEGIMKMFSRENSSIYIGQFAGNKRQGRGKMIESNGSVYQGEWFEDKKHGFGVSKSSTGQHYEGTFARGQKQGFGFEYFKNGDMYKGQYAQGKFEGKGEYLWKNSAKYEGEFSRGKRNGQGIWRSSDEQGAQIYEGSYVNDKKSGFGIYKWPNGAYYQGEFERDMKHGIGKTVYENGKVAVLEWAEGKTVRQLDESEWPDGFRQKKTLRHLGQRATQKKAKINTFIESQKRDFTKFDSKELSKASSLFEPEIGSLKKQPVKMNFARHLNSEKELKNDGDELRQARYQPVGSTLNIQSI